MISTKRLIKSFRHAFEGLKTAFVEEQNFKLMAFAVAVSLVVIVLKPMPLSYRAAIVLAGGLLLAVELLNTAAERAMDALSPDSLEEIRKIKDMTAGAALVASIAWVVVFAWVLFA
ncbi:diacylglycerol kinase [Candidatus Azambacteria bacterium]|nr:diacylglycerol kinase [Candidatus Azambacteria bacterium]